MIKYLIVILDSAAPSFCYYPSAASPSHLISESELERITLYAREKELIINFLYGIKKIPQKHQELVEKTEHIKMVPLELVKEYENNIIIVNKNNIHLLDNLSDDMSRNLILKLEKNNLNELFDIFKKLRGKFKRLNLHLMDIPAYEEKDINLYKVQVEKIAELLISEYKKGNAYECNFLSDRILLNSMKNCNAGIDHITVGPNGNYYLCPGFYSEDGNNTIEFEENDCIVRNSTMLSLKEAPICSICDCYHCKRCYYLNNQVTMQLNTPSYQQCVLSHHERNASRHILSTLHKIKEFKDLNHIQPIPEINYLDPFELIIGQQKSIGTLPPVKMQETNPPKLNTKSIPKKTDTMKTMIENKSPGLNPSKQTPVIHSKSTPNSRWKSMSLSEFKTLSVKEMLIELFKTQQELMKEFTIRDKK